MIGQAAQFEAFRILFRRHLSSVTEVELQQIERRLEHLKDDVKLRREYLKTITPIAIIRGEQP